jgi:hypothetical protein
MRNEATPPTPTMNSIRIVIRIDLGVSPKAISLFHKNGDEVRRGSQCVTLC